MTPGAEAFAAALPDHAARPAGAVVPIGRCVGVAASEGDALSVVLQRPDGALHVLSMDVTTALALALAIRADIRL